MLVDHAAQIFDGWFRVLFESPEDLERAKERYEKGCKSCDHNKEIRAARLFVNRVEYKRDTRKCDLCGCPLVAKLRAKDATCDAGKW